MEEKKVLRQKMKATLKNLDPETFAQGVKDVHSGLFHSDVWKKAKTIAVTVSQGTEMDTREIIERAWNEAKTVAVPKCDAKNKRLVFRQIQSFNQLETEYYGLLEPIESETSVITKEEMDVIIVPGLVFDRQGYRIGFGGGYYDRFLKDVDTLKIAQALDVQIIDRIPVEAHDIPVDVLFTPSEMIHCGRK
ncbi:MAG: 5-formyltetrahydrofolate cyclo-ligase [Tuberibacillus sp.]